MPETSSLTSMRIRLVPMFRVLHARACATMYRSTCSRCLLYMSLLVSIRSARIDRTESAKFESGIRRRTVLGGAQPRHRRVGHAHGRRGAVALVSVCYPFRS